MQNAKMTTSAQPPVTQIPRHCRPAWGWNRATTRQSSGHRLTTVVQRHHDIWLRAPWTRPFDCGKPQPAGACERSSAIWRASGPWLLIPFASYLVLKIEWSRSGTPERGNASALSLDILDPSPALALVTVDLLLEARTERSACTVSAADVVFSSFPFSFFFSFYGLNRDIPTLRSSSIQHAAHWFPTYHVFSTNASCFA